MKYALMVLMLSGCAHKQDNQDFCMKLMKKEKIPVCSYEYDHLAKTNPYEFGYQLGMSSGFFSGCMMSRIEE